MRKKPKSHVLTEACFFLFHFGHAVSFKWKWRVSNKNRIHLIRFYWKLLSFCFWARNIFIYYLCNFFHMFAWDLYSVHAIHAHLTHLSLFVWTVNSEQCTWTWTPYILFTLWMVFISVYFWFLTTMVIIFIRRDRYVLLERRHWNNNVQMTLCFSWCWLLFTFSLFFSLILFISLSRRSFRNILPSIFD